MKHFSYNQNKGWEKGGCHGKQWSYINFQGEISLSRSCYYEWHSHGPIFLVLSFHKGRVHISVKKCPFIFFMICQHHLIKRHLVFKGGVQKKITYIYQNLWSSSIHMYITEGIAVWAKIPQYVDVAFWTSFRVESYLFWPRYIRKKAWMAQTVISLLLIFSYCMKALLDSHIIWMSTFR